MKPSFKQYVALSTLSEDEIVALSEEQLDEIFGKFFGKAPEKQDLQAKKDELLAQKAKLRKERDAKFAAAKARIENPPAKKVGTSTMVPSGKTSQAAMGRASERDWAASLADDNA